MALLSFQQFISKWLGRKCDYDGHYGGQCVDLFRMYLKEVLGFKQPRGVIGAADFWANFESDPNLKKQFIKIPNTPTGVPQVGDIVIWSKRYNKFGHISIFISGGVWSFFSFDQNNPTLSKCTQTKHSYIYVLGWLRPIK